MRGEVPCIEAGERSAINLKVASQLGVVTVCDDAFGILTDAQRQSFDVAHVLVSFLAVKRHTAEGYPVREAVLCAKLTPAAARQLADYLRTAADELDSDCGARPPPPMEHMNEKARRVG